ncbi:MAG: hypothetical protein ACOY0T_09530 [Myxococcota bacterium]
MKITTAQLLTSRDGFGLTTAGPVQLSACHVRDGKPLPPELHRHPDVIAAFGGEEAVAALPSERGIKPGEFFNIASARTAKTTLAVASAIVDSQTIEVSGLGHGEIPRISIVSLKLDVADVPFRRLVDTMKASRVLEPLIVDVGTDWLTIRHPSGKLVEVAVVAGARAASGLVARWCAGAIFDEAPRMSGREDGVVNLSDALSAIRERLLPGAQIQCIGSPWAPSGPVYDAVQQYFGKPTSDVVVLRTTGPAGNPSYWTPERLDRLREKDEVAWRINALGEFIDPEQGLFNPVAIRRHTRETPLELPRSADAAYAAAVDVGKGRWTLVIIETPKAKGVRMAYQAKEPATFKVALAREFLSSDPEHAWADVARACRAYGIETAVVDQYAANESAAIAKRHGLKLRERAWTASNRLEAFTDAATLVHTGRVEHPPERTYRKDVLGVRKRTTQQGYSIHLPTTSDGRHSDFAPAFVAALEAANKGTAEHSNAYSQARASLKRTALDPWMLPPKEYSK